MSVDEVYINGRRYRVPERVILLDFWDRVSSGKAGVPAYVVSQSPLNSKMLMGSLDVMKIPGLLLLSPP